jgi:hypothetical protein
MRLIKDGGPETPKLRELLEAAQRMGVADAPLTAVTVNGS